MPSNLKTILFRVMVGAAVLLQGCTPVPQPLPDQALLVGYRTMDTGSVVFVAEGAEYVQLATQPGAQKFTVRTTSPPQFPEPGEAPESYACIEKSEQELTVPVAPGRVYRISLSRRARCVHELTVVQLRSVDGPEGQVIKSQAQTRACSRRCTDLSFLHFGRTWGR